MNFVCPICELGGSVDDAILPKGGAWATCPSCKEKFHIKKELPLEFTFSFAPEPPPLIDKLGDISESINDSDTQGNGGRTSLNISNSGHISRVSKASILYKILLILVLVPIALLIYGFMNDEESNQSNRNSTNQNYDVRQEITKRELRIRAIDNEIAVNMSVSSPRNYSDTNLNHFQADSNSSARAIYEGENFKLKSEREMILEQLKLLYQQQTTGK